VAGLGTVGCTVYRVTFVLDESEWSMDAKALGLIQLAFLSLVTAAPVRSTTPAERGLKFEWFDGENFETKVGQRVEYKISTVFGEAAAGRGGACDHFSCRWSGFIRAPRAGTYELKAWADDGFRVKLDGKTILDGWTDGTAQTTAVKLKTEPREIVYEMREAEEVASATLGWRMEGEPIFVAMPPSVFFQSKEVPASRKIVRNRGEGIAVTVFHGRDFKKAQKCSAFEDGIDDNIDWDFFEDGIDEAVAAKNFSMRWKGFIVAPTPGSWRIKAWADNGVRVKIDGVALIDDLRFAHGARATTFEFDDRPHEIEVEFFQADGRAYISLHWAKDGDVAEQVIPPNAYYTDLASAQAACKPKESKK
jgi:hypothetical protein